MNYNEKFKGFEAQLHEILRSQKRSKT